MIWFRPVRGLAGLAGFIASSWLVVGVMVAPLIDPVRSGHALMTALEANLAPDESVGLVGWKEQFLLYLDDPVTVFGHRRFDRQQELHDAVAWMQRGQKRRLFLPETAARSCFAGRGLLIGYAHGENWYLTAPGDLTAECAAQPGRPEAARVYDAPPEHESHDH
jgi:hypothetical protein